MHQHKDVCRVGRPLASLLVKLAFGSNVLDGADPMLILTGRRVRILHRLGVGQDKDSLANLEFGQAIVCLSHPVKSRNQHALLSGLPASEAMNNCNVRHAYLRLASTRLTLEGREWLVSGAFDRFRSRHLLHDLIA